MSSQKTDASMYNASAPDTSTAISQSTAGDATASPAETQQAERESVDRLDWAYSQEENSLYRPTSQQVSVTPRPRSGFPSSKRKSTNGGISGSNPAAGLSPAIGDKPRHSIWSSQEPRG
ncbi:hypothetical protein IAR55_003175 [Kwoniella newhampshirensis]|uniref:Uncharacterized protein n=1 Tax=Kwoniella newhampshirensis TaxID=1651941 RepID=A0AAW0YZV9_9TREE